MNSNIPQSLNTPTAQINATARSSSSLSSSIHTPPPQIQAPPSQAEPALTHSRTHNSPPFLLSLLTLEEAAAWWRIRPRELSLKSKGRRARIPGIWFNQRVVRFSPLLMLAKAALDIGLPTEFIAALGATTAVAPEQFRDAVNELIKDQREYESAPYYSAPASAEVANQQAPPEF